MIRQLGSRSGRAILAVVALGVAAGWFSPVGATTTPLLIITSSLAPGEVGAAYSLHLLASGGTAPYRWSTTTPLGNGFTLSPAGLLSGTPEASTEQQLIVTVTDGAQAVTSASLALDVLIGPSITTSTMLDPVLGVPYSGLLAASGGTPPYTWSVTSGPLPLGLVLNSGGVLTGLPAMAGPTTTTIAVTDAAGSRASEQLALNVESSPITQQAYLVTSTTGAVSAFASPGVVVPQTIDDGPDAVVAIATDAGSNRFWIATANGRVESAPGAPSFGSLGPRQLVGRIVAIAATPDGKGYWLASSTGAVYGFGTARVLHRRGSARLSPRVVAIAADPNGNGYWLVTRAGRVYAYGRAALAGSIPAGEHLRSVVGIAAAPGGGGYWLVTRSGAVDAFGTATALPGVEVAPGSRSVVAIASAP